MSSSKKGLLIVLAGVILMVSACTSLRADLFLIKQTSPQKKADMLYQEGLVRYNQDLKTNNDLTKIPEIRRYFSDAVTLDPMNTKAQQYLNKIDSFKTTLFTANMETAKKLAAVEKRTDTQNYQLVFAVKQASDLKPGDKDLAKIKASIKDLPPLVIQKHEERIAVLEPKILAEKDPKALLKLLNEANTVLSELHNIDPSNKAGAQSRIKIDTYVASLTQKDIDTAQAKLTAKKYADAETAVLRAEKSHAAISSEKNPQIQNLKYGIYYAWGTDLFTAKKYQAAGDKASLAISANRTTDALALKTKINKAAAVRDFDADISDILDSVDALLARGDPSGAQDIIDSNLPNLKIQANKNSLSAKTADVTAQIKIIYQAGISLYNEEDYEGAAQKFKVVVDINGDYEQAQSYLDKSNTKIRALSGKD